VNEVLIRAATVITVDPDDRLLASGWIHVRDGVIVGLGAGRAPDLADATAIDGSGMVAIPGLVNAHTHLFQTLIRGLLDGLPFVEWLRRIYHCGRALDTPDWGLSAALGAVESVRSGVTTIADHQFLHRGTEWSDAIIDGVRSVGPRLVLARTAMDIGDLAPPESLESQEEWSAAVDALLATHADEIAAGTVRILVGPNTPGVSASDELCRAAARHAEERGIGLAMHVSESRDVLEATERRYGVSGVVRWLDGLDTLPTGTLAAHCVHLDDEEIAILARRQVAVAHNPVSNLYLGDGIAPVSQLLAAGVTVALGTDGAASNNSQDLFEVMKLAALLPRIREPRPRPVTPLDALRMATMGGARALGMDDRVGSLEVGKRADITLVHVGTRAHMVPVHDVVTELVLNGRAADVAGVLVDGQILMEDGRLTTVDEAAVIAEARSRGVIVGERLRALD
jgi:5-methylthioadenosine/S-adenosylhomocysteine deaminase